MGYIACFITESIYCSVVARGNLYVSLITLDLNNWLKLGNSVTLFNKESNNFYFSDSFANICQEKRGSISWRSCLQTPPEKAVQSCASRQRSTTWRPANPKRERHLCHNKPAPLSLDGGSTLRKYLIFVFIRNGGTG